jgi:hypothetical protein
MDRGRGQYDDESRARDARLEALVQQLLTSIQRLEDRVAAVERWRDRHLFEGHG